MHGYSHVNFSKFEMLRNIPKQRGFYTFDNYWKARPVIFGSKSQLSVFQAEFYQAFADPAVSRAYQISNSVLLVCEKVLC